VIFGFNTDVKFGDTVYHVQSEAHEAEHRLETQIFVKGRCLGKHATSYATMVNQPHFSEDRMHEMLKEQHHHFVDAARQGFIEDEIAAAEKHAASDAPQAVAPQAAAAKPAPVLPELTLQPMAKAIGKGLTIACLTPSVATDGSEVTVYFQIGEEGGDPAADAQVTCRITGAGAPAYVYGQSGPGGMADIRVALQGLDLSKTAILVQASHRGKSVSRKFSLKKK
jgi:hypothetical protein